MEERGTLHRIEDDLSETWVEDWAGAGELLARLAELTADDPEDPARAPAYRAERERLLREAGELAWLGGSARARSAVVEASREALLAAQPAPPLTTDATFEVASELLGVANDLRRKHERYADSLPYYHAALVVSLQLRDPSGLSAALVGLGGSYNRLAGQAARAGLLELDSRRDELGDHSQLRRATAAAISTGRAWELTELALASRVWVLEEAKARGDLVAQANQISNLAETEERLGNLETAARYQRWAERVHSEAGDFEAAAIDARELVGYAKHLGDDEDLARWERRRGELGAMAEAARD